MKQKQIKKFPVDYWQDYIQNVDPSVMDWFKEETRFLRQNIKKGSAVLDVGCGFGRSLEAITDIARELVGIDIDNRLCKSLVKTFSKFENMQFFCEDAKKTHFNANTFDYVICMGNAFGTFSQDKLSVLWEMRRVAKKNGKIILSVSSEKALSVRLSGYLRAGYAIEKVEDGTVYANNGLVLEQFDKEKISKLFQLIGLDVKITELNPIAYICEATV